MNRFALARINTIQAGMAEVGLDASVFLKPQNVYYLSNWNSVVLTNPTFVVVPRKGDPVLLAWAHRLDHARQEAWIEDIRLFGHWGTRKGIAHTGPEAVAAILNGWNARQAGIEMEYLPTGISAQLGSLVPGLRTADISSVIWHARYVKDQEELRRMRIAGRLADTGMERALATLKAGITEAEVAVSVEHAMRARWAAEFADGEVAGFPGQEGGVVSGLWCWCLSGPRINFPADTPKGRSIRHGDPVFIAIWATYEGYLVENERTILVGKPSARVQRAFECMIASREAAFGAMRPGVPVSVVYEAAMKPYRDFGYEDQLPGRIGHGIGLGGHEHPSIAASDPTVLEEGMVLTMEPALFVEGTGLRHSDTVIVRRTGPEFLTTTHRYMLGVDV